MPAALAIPLITAAIGAGGSIGSALISKHKGGSGSTPLLPAGLDQNALLSSITQQKDLAKTFQTQGANFLGQGSDTLKQPLDFFKSILGGDRTSILQSLAPEIANINAQFKAPLTEAGISGRGSSLAPDLEASKQSAISNQLFQARPAAADKLTGIAQGLMNLGLGSEQAGANVLGQATQETLDYNAIIRGIQAQQSAQSSSAFGSLGLSLGPILAQVLGGLNKGGGNLPSLPTPNFPISNLPGQVTVGGGGDLMNPALTSSLINYGEQSPDFYSSWLDGGG